MTLYTVQVTGAAAPVEVYGGLTACDEHLLYSDSEGAIAYTALSTDARKKKLVDATRYIDRKRWQGTRNAAGGTTLAFPRDGLEDEDGETATDAYQLDLVARAAFELAAVLAVESSVASDPDQGSNVKAMGAGSARIEFFGPTSPRMGTASKLPTVVNELLGQWLAGAGGISSTITAGGSSTGACDSSIFDGDHGYERSEGF